MTTEQVHPLADPEGAVEPDRISVFVASVASCWQAVGARGYEMLLEPAEAERASRFVFERDRRRFIVTRALARTMLARETGLAPTELRFSENRWGRPELAGPPAPGRRVRFNLSHSADLVVLALTHTRDIGIDVEQPREAPLDLADRFFASDEAAALWSLPEAARDRRFFEYWTLKEAYMKARGVGLSLGLDRFAFRLDRPGEIDFDVNPEIDNDASRWRFWQFEIARDYLVALCSDTGGHNPTIVLSRVVPLVSQSVMSIAPVRISGGALPRRDWHGGRQCWH